MSRQATYPAATNLVQILRMLFESYYGLVGFQEIIERLQISRKTLMRYVKVFEETFDDLIVVQKGSDLGRSPGNERYLVFKRYALESRTGYQLAPLYLSRFFMSFLEGTLLDESFQDAVNIFESEVEKPKSKYRAGSFGKKFFAVSIGPKSYANHDETIEILLQAIMNQNPVTVEYKKPQDASPKTYNFDPLTMMIYKQGLYVIGQNHGWENPHFFAIERIVRCERDPRSHFDYPESYSPQEFCHGSFGIFVDEDVEVRIRFSPDVPHEYITSRRWHPSQQVTICADQSLELTMKVSGTQELFSWILSFGKNAKVLEPDDLRQKIIDEIGQLSQQYQS